MWTGAGRMGERSLTVKLGCLQSLRCFGFKGMSRWLPTDKLIRQPLRVAGSRSLVSATPDYFFLPRPRKWLAAMGVFGEGVLSGMWPS